MQRRIACGVCVFLDSLVPFGPLYSLFWLCVARFGCSLFCGISFHSQSFFSAGFSPNQNMALCGKYTRGLAANTHSHTHQMKMCKSNGKEMRSLSRKKNNVNAKRIYNGKIWMPKGFLLAALFLLFEWRMLVLLSIHYNVVCTVRTTACLFGSLRVLVSFIGSCSPRYSTRFAYIVPYAQCRMKF